MRPVLDVSANGALQARSELLARRADDLNDLRPLVDVVRAGEEHFAANELREDATNGPDVD